MDGNRRKGKERNGIISHDDDREVDGGSGGVNVQGRGRQALFLVLVKKPPAESFRYVIKRRTLT